MRSAAVPRVGNLLVDLSDGPGFHSLAVFFRRAGVDDDAIGHAVGVAAAAVLQEQVDARPHDDRARRAVELERHENAGRRVLLQVDGGTTVVRHDHPDLRHTAGFHIVDFKADQSVFHWSTLGRSLLGADIETAHADELMLAGIQRDGAPGAAVAEAPDAGLILVRLAVAIAVPLVRRGVFLVSVDAVDIGVALIRASVAPQRLAIVARGGVVRGGIHRAEGCCVGVCQMLRDDHGIGDCDRAVAVEVQLHELLLRQLATTSAVVGGIDDDQDVDGREVAVGVKVEGRRGGEGEQGRGGEGDCRLRIWDFRLQTLTSEFRIRNSDFFHGSNLREEIGGEDDAGVEVFEVQTPRARLGRLTPPS